MIDYNLWFKKIFPGLKPDGLWSILPDAAHYLYFQVQGSKPEAILEFGSGVSTAVMAKAAAPYGGKVYALEHEPDCLEKTRQDCHTCGLKNFEVIHAPIVSSRFEGVADFRIHDPGKIPPEHFAFVFIDSPPGFLPEHAGRRGTLLTAWPFLTSKATVILDDARRAGEQAALKEWRQVFGSGIQVTEINIGRTMARIDLTTRPI